MSEPYYEDGSVTIYHGDCRDLLPMRAAGVIVTDPPYGIGWKRGTNKARFSKPHEGIAGDSDTSLRDLMLDRHPITPAVVFGSFYAPPPPRVRQVLVWHKPADSGVVGSTTGHRRDAEPIFLIDPWPTTSVEWSSVLRSHQQSIKAVCAETGHPHSKPVDLMRTLIERAPKGVVLDPFMGAGSTLVAAKSIGRKVIGIELEERYCEVAAKRCAQEVLDLGATA